MGIKRLRTLKGKKITPKGANQFLLGFTSIDKDGKNQSIKVEATESVQVVVIVGWFAAGDFTTYQLLFSPCYIKKQNIKQFLMLALSMWPPALNLTLPDLYLWYLSRHQ